MAPAGVQFTVADFYAFEIFDDDATPVVRRTGFEVARAAALAGKLIAEGHLSTVFVPQRVRRHHADVAVVTSPDVHSSDDRLSEYTICRSHRDSPSRTTGWIT